jgi:hypothetical protein
MQNIKKSVCAYFYDFTFDFNMISLSALGVQTWNRQVLVLFREVALQIEIYVCVCVCARAHAVS